MSAGHSRPFPGDRAIVPAATPQNPQNIDRRRSRGRPPSCFPATFTLVNIANITVEFGAPRNTAGRSARCAVVSGLVAGMHSVRLRGIWTPMKRSRRPTSLSICVKREGKWNAKQCGETEGKCAGVCGRMGLGGSVAFDGEGEGAADGEMADAIGGDFGLGAREDRGVRGCGRERWRAGIP